MDKEVIKALIEGIDAGVYTAPELEAELSGLRGEAALQAGLDLLNARVSADVDKAIAEAGLDIAASGSRVTASLVDHQVEIDWSYIGWNSLVRIRPEVIHYVRTHIIDANWFAAELPWSALDGTSYDTSLDKLCALYEQELKRYSNQQKALDATWERYKKKAEGEVIPPDEEGEEPVFEDHFFGGREGFDENLPMLFKGWKSYRKLHVDHKMSKAPLPAKLTARERCWVDLADKARKVTRIVGEKFVYTGTDTMKYPTDGSMITTSRIDEAIAHYYWERTDDQNGECPGASLNLVEPEEDNRRFGSYESKFDSKDVQRTLIGIEATMAILTEGAKIQ